MEQKVINKLNTPMIKMRYKPIFQCFWVVTFLLALQSYNDILLPFSVRARSEKSPFLDFSSPGEFNGSDGSVAV